MAVPGQGLTGDEMSRPERPERHPEARTYEEAERRRAAALGRESLRSPTDDILLLVFVALAFFAVFSLIAPWSGIIPADFPLTTGSSAAAFLVLLVHRSRAYAETRSGLGAAAYALGDAMIYAGLMAAATWVLAFPLVNPLPSETVLVGVVSLVIISAFVVVLRFVQPGVVRGPDRPYSDIESSIKQLEGAVTRLSSRLPQGEAKAEAGSSDRLTAMMGELEAMRKEFAALRASVPPPGARGGTVVFGVSKQREGTAPEPKKAQETVSVVRPEGGSAPPPPQEEMTAPSVPDSAVDNPWLNVLAKRRAKDPSTTPAS